MSLGLVLHSNGRFPGGSGHTFIEFGQACKIALHRGRWDLNLISQNLSVRFKVYIKVAGINAWGSRCPISQLQTQSDL